MRKWRFRDVMWWTALLALNPSYCIYHVALRLLIITVAKCSRVQDGALPTRRKDGNKDVNETQDISKAKAALEIVSIMDPSIPDYQIWAGGRMPSQQGQRAVRQGCANETPWPYLQNHPHQATLPKSPQLRNSLSSSVPVPLQTTLCLVTKVIPFFHIFPYL